ncbi:MULTISPECIES: hypothetical protein [Methylocystis]|uniref:hypothetical protein n=1 Tax=Methylocystis TaxID=133 RepID=UPI0024BBBCCC|nr:MULTISPECIES: hypothetical protein [Methylocystis]MDJ0450949.1 hypothetical protein [Methylocystis sp. JR02]
MLKNADLRLENFRYLTGLGREAFSALVSVCFQMEAQGNHVRDHFFSVEFDRNRKAWKAIGGKAHSYFEPGGLEVVIPGGDATDLTLSMRMGYLHPNHKSLKGTYSVYAHKLFFDSEADTEDGYIYVGLTKQGWRQRLTGHLQSARSGSNTLFHKALRAKPKIIRSHVLMVGADEDQAMSFEEDRVAAFSYYLDHPKGLNMIPGGKAGFKFLSKYVGATPCKLEDRESLLDRLLKERRVSLPNPVVAALWDNPDYAARVLCGRSDRFSLGALRTIIDLHAVGHSPPELADRFGASEKRVRNLISGKTYGRVLK